MSERIMPPILGFQGEFRFLSHFWPSVVVHDGVEYPTVEHAYVAAKFDDLGVRQQVLMCQTPGQAKRLGRKYSDLLRPDFDTIKVPLMEELDRQKYTKHSDLRAALLLTGDAYIEEQNTWGDVFWGTCNGKGRNELGLLLMRIRAELGGEA